MYASLLQHPGDLRLGVGRGLVLTVCASACDGAALVA